MCVYFLCVTIQLRVQIQISTGNSDIYSKCTCNENAIYFEI